MNYKIQLTVTMFPVGGRLEPGSPLNSKLAYQQSNMQYQSTMYNSEMLQPMLQNIPNQHMTTIYFLSPMQQVIPLNNICPNTENTKHQLLRMSSTSEEEE